MRWRCSSCVCAPRSVVVHSRVCAGVQGALHEQQQVAAAATSLNAGLGRDSKEAKIEAMIARRAGAAKRAAFGGWIDVVVLKKLDK